MGGEQHVEIPVKNPAWNQSFTLLNWLIQILEYISGAPSSFLL